MYSKIRLEVQFFPRRLNHFELDKQDIKMASNFLFVRVYNSETLKTFTRERVGESKIGQTVQHLAETRPHDYHSMVESLSKAKSGGAIFSIVLIPEDIGPRANEGRPGASEAPEAFMNYFCNLQDNRFLDGNKIVVLGEIMLNDLMETSFWPDVDLKQMRTLCQEVDSRVEPVVKAIFEAGLVPIVVGGGNNNSLPVVRALNGAANKNENGIAVVNCDPHADFRKTEGRHSGNPFSYAAKEGILKR